MYCDMGNAITAAVSLDNRNYLFKCMVIIYYYSNKVRKVSPAISKFLVHVFSILILVIVHFNHFNFCVSKWCT